ncbi:hypothetical protein Bca52824_065643 [Brassica carinata]|uniref:Transmembrane protein n=1 Tax=Brassica carinata TaxID=52824 RepID=A0A8X7QJR6_BRACI|nr:hypothetical protein Bca52824_065643 [Brassica carinata]
METNPSKSSVLIYVLVLALVLSPILPCQPASVHLGVDDKQPLLMCPHCECCAPAAPGFCCPCSCPGGP